jgi:hypothetical protein
MKKMKLKGLIVGLVILSNLSMDCMNVFALEFCEEHERIYIPTLEYAKANKRILLVGMSHIGPKAYFPRARQTIDQYIRADSNSTILTEFLTCHASTRDVVPGTKLPLDKLRRLESSGDDVSFLGDAIVFKECALDFDGRTLRPSYLVDRNRLICDAFHKNGLGCQWEDFILPDSGRNIAVQAGDMIIDQEPASTQVIASLAYRSFGWVGPNLEAGQAEFLNSVLTLMLRNRNGRLVQKALAVLAVSDQVILPWGFVHLDGMGTLLESHGFRKTAVGDVYFAGPEDVGKWKYFDKILRQWLRSAEPRTKSCRLASTRRARLSNP